MKHKKIVTAGLFAAAAVILALVGIRMTGRGSKADPANTAYVEKVAVLTGSLNGAGAVNRFAGVVESQETWSIKQNPDTQLKEIKVQVGQEVKKGDPLFVYDTDKYQSDLSQAEIALERLNHELETIKKTIGQLEAEKKKAPAADQANYTIRIQEQTLTQQQKELDIESKQIDIDKLKSNIENATVVSEMDGVVQAIQKTGDGASASGGSDDSLMTIMKTGDFRVKGTVKEQNVGQLSEGMEVIVHSRVDDRTWKGKIQKIDTNTKQNTDASAMYGGNASASSSSYPFYVELESHEGLMMGQHVYLEPDYGQDEKKEGLWLSEFYLDLTDTDHPFVWADDGKGRLEKREVHLGDHNEELMEYQITEGLTEEDAIAMPDVNLKEGMKTAPMEEMVPVLSGSEGMESQEGMEVPEGMGAPDGPAEGQTGPAQDMGQEGMTEETEAAPSGAEGGA